MDQIAPDFRETRQLDNGTSLIIRPIVPEDAQIEWEFVHGLSEQSRYYRFCAGTRDLTPAMVKGTPDELRTAGGGGRDAAGGGGGASAAGERGGPEAAKRGPPWRVQLEAPWQADACQGTRLFSELLDTRAVAYGEIFHHHRFEYTHGADRGHCSA